MLVIGLVAKKRHGKTTIGDIIKRGFPQIYVCSFADSLKEIVRDAFQLYKDDEELKKSQAPVNNIDWNHAKETLVDYGYKILGISVEKDVEQVIELLKQCKTMGEFYRKALQNVGTEVFRKYDNQVWIKKLAEKIQGRLFVLITDVRFPDEAEFLKTRYNAKLVAIVRRDIQSNDTHASETGVDKIIESSMVDRIYYTDKYSDVYPIARDIALMFVRSSSWKALHGMI